MSVDKESTHKVSAVNGTAKQVADAFLCQYYQILGISLEQVHRFYDESSVVSRPGLDGSMASVTTLKGIDNFIQSLYSKGDSLVEICAVDAQFSYGDGLVILVTGLIGSEELKRRFSQMFFLAPQEKGYYVLNDVFHYCGDDVSAPIAVVEKDLVVAAAEETELTAVQVKAGIVKKYSESAVVDKEVIVEPKTSLGEKITTNKSASSNGQPNGKLSYASIIKAPASATPASQSAPAAPKPLVKASPSPSPVAFPPAPVSSIAKEHSNIIADNVKRSSQSDDQKVEDRSVSVWELPLSIKPYQLDRSFSRKFGPVKQGGIQIRNAQGKNGPICYAFIEFESATSAEAAIKASPVSIDGRPVIVKRKTNKGKNNGKPRNGSPQRDNNNSNRTHVRHRDASNDSNNVGHRSENGHISVKTNGHKTYPHDKTVTPSPLAKPEPEIDEDGFQTVSRNGKYKTQGN
ncbi:unnamed protein product [Rhodiola kirilowii]